MSHTSAWSAASRAAQLEMATLAAVDESFLHSRTRRHRHPPLVVSALEVGGACRVF